MVQTGVDNGDTGARAGVALSPGVGGAHHEEGGVGGVGMILLRVLGGLILVLQEDALDAGHRPNGVQVAVANLGGDDVHQQGQIPFDVQLGADGGLNPGLGVGLLGLQAVPVADRSGVFRNVFHGVAHIQRGGVLQLDGYANQVRGLEGLKLPGELRGVAGRGGLTAIRGVFRADSGHQQGPQQRQNQQQGKQLAQGLDVLHRCFSFSVFALGHRLYLSTFSKKNQWNCEIIMKAT